MACVSKEYEIKATMVHEEWLQLQTGIFIELNLKIVI